MRDQTSSWFGNCGKNREKSVWELGQEKGGTDDLGIVGKIGFQIFWNHRGKFHVPNSSSVFHFPLLPSPCPPYPSLPVFFPELSGLFDLSVFSSQIISCLFFFSTCRVFPVSPSGDKELSKTLRNPRISHRLIPFNPRGLLCFPKELTSQSTGISLFLPLVGFQPHIWVEKWEKRGR